jgi:hypothetical protein
MLKKTRPTDKGMVKVTFVLGSAPDAHHVHVAGTFNDWQASTPMRRQKNGTWRATVELAPGHNYEFRYLVDGNLWVNDEAADAYVPNPFWADNCLLRTPELEPAPAPVRRSRAASSTRARSAARGSRGGEAIPAGGEGGTEA